MFGSSMLEVAIGLVFVYFILSLLVTAALELLEAKLQSRAIHLERGIRELLNDQDGTGLTSRLFNHPLIASLYTGTYQPEIQLATKRGGGKDPWKRLKFGTTLPAYIPARNFATALLDLSARGDVVSSDFGTQAVSFERIRAGVATHIPSQRIQRVVLIALDDARGDLERARANLEAWYDSSMDRVSGWYRKQTQWVLFGMGLIAAVALNVDTTRIASTLYADEDRRAVLVAQAQAAVDAAGAEGEKAERMLRALGCDPNASGAAAVNCIDQSLEQLGLPIGWSGYVWPWSLNGDELRSAIGPFVMSLLGWLITALAVTLGAPFWFDILNKVMVIRSTVKPHEKSPEEDSEDRQIKTGRAPGFSARSDGAGRAAAPQPEERGTAPGVPALGAGGAAAGLSGAETADDADDPDEHEDRCLSTIDLSEEEETRDEELPVATGGVEDPNRQGM